MPTALSVFLSMTLLVNDSLFFVSERSQTYVPKIQSYYSHTNCIPLLSQLVYHFQMQKSSLKTGSFIVSVESSFQELEITV